MASLKNDEYKTINEVIRMMPYVAPMREVLNIYPNELQLMRIYLICYICISFLSLCLLFILNNYHIFSFYKKKAKLILSHEDVTNHEASSIFLKTLSVLNYINYRNSVRYDDNREIENDEFI